VELRRKARKYERAKFSRLRLGSGLLSSMRKRTARRFPGPRNNAPPSEKKAIAWPLEPLNNIEVNAAPRLALSFLGLAVCLWNSKGETWRSGSRFERESGWPVERAAAFRVESGTDRDICPCSTDRRLVSEFARKARGHLTQRLRHGQGISSPRVR
jgi:hypothetical protein